MKLISNPDSGRDYSWPSVIPHRLRTRVVPCFGYLLPIPARYKAGATTSEVQRLALKEAPAGGSGYRIPCYIYLRRYGHGYLGNRAVHSLPTSTVLLRCKTIQSWLNWIALALTFLAWPGERQETSLANLAPFRRTFTGSSERLFVVLLARLLVVAVAQLVPSTSFRVGAVRAVKRLIVGGVSITTSTHTVFSVLDFRGNSAARDAIVHHPCRPYYAVTRPSCVLHCPQYSYAFTGGRIAIICNESPWIDLTGAKAATGGLTLHTLSRK